MSLQESGEMYLESILVLSKRGPVRSIDIVEFMNYSKPSVSRAVGLLKKGEFLEMDKNGFLELTELGQEIAQKIYDRHTIITKYLISIGVDEETAAQDACKMEHVISQESFEAIKKYIGK